MAMKLWVHVLRGATLDLGGAHSAAPSIDPRRWALRDLVVRRIGFAHWGLANAVAARGTGLKQRDPVAEPLWADTQPWCHK